MPPRLHKSGMWAKISDPERGIASGKKLDLRPLIVVAHPDDETIGACVSMSRMRDAAAAFITDGAPRDPRFWSPDARASREEYAQTRTREAEAALAIMGISSQRIFSLGAVDQKAIEQVSELVHKLRLVIQQTQPDVIITHPYEGGHPDHDAAALIAHLATGSAGVTSRTEILEMASYHARSGQCIRGEFLPDSSEDELTLWLSAEERTKKQQMVACHYSQRLVLQDFPLNPERLRPAPRNDFTRPPHEGKLWYECLGWPMSGECWRQLATGALAECQ